MKKTLSLLAALLLLLSVLTGCQSGTPAPAATEAPTAVAVTDDGEPFAHPDNDKDFSALKTPGSQESAYEYRNFFLPAVDGINQPYCGDPMPYYEDGTYYVYYLKEGGDSYNHSFYLATTTDFVTWTETDEPVLEANRGGGQDAWLGTGSVVKVKDTYYFFYTAHAASAASEYGETLMVARGSSPTSFEKVEGFEILPPDELHQKRDFRDPQAYYDAETDTIDLTVTAAADGTARILKYSLSGDLAVQSYDGIIFTDPTASFWNLECSDTFRLGDTYYLTYSGQDDTLWYASSDKPYGPYGEAKRLDGKLFYAAKHVENGNEAYMVGWVRRSESPSSTSEVSAWGGNLAAQRIEQLENGDLALVPVDAVAAQFVNRREIPAGATEVTVNAGSRYGYADAFTAYESYLLKGKFTFSGDGAFGLAFDYNGKAEKYKFITLDPAAGKLQLQFNEGETLITETAVTLEKDKEYTFTYIQEGSVGFFYVENASLAVRLYGVSGKIVRFWAGNNNVRFFDLREYTR